MKTLNQIFAEILSERLRYNVDMEYIYIREKTDTGWVLDANDELHTVTVREVLEKAFLLED